MDKVKILQIITLSEWGGAQRVVYDLVTNLPKDKFLVEVATAKGGLLVQKLREQGIKVYEVAFLQREINLLKDFKVLFALYKLIKKGKYDIVHCHSTKAGFLGRMAAKLSRVKKIYFTAHSWAFYNTKEYKKKKKLFILLQKITSPITTKIICVSDKVKIDGIKNKIAKKDKLQVIKNGTDIALQDTKEIIRNSLNISSNKKIIIMISRLAYPKDPLLFLRTALIVKSKFKEAKFMLIGGGVLMKQCKEFIKQHSLEQTVAIFGDETPEGTRKLLKLSDIFVLCSHFEGLPITIIEAMASCLPVIASNVGGVRELVEDNKTGFLLHQQSPAELAKKIIYLLKNKNEAQKFGKLGKTKAEKEFSVSTMVKQYQNLYE